MKLHTMIRLAAAALCACLLCAPSKLYAADVSSPTAAAGGALLKNIAFSGASLSSPLAAGETRYLLVCSVSPDEVAFQGCETVEKDAKVHVLRRYDTAEQADYFEITVASGSAKTGYRFYLPQNWEGAQKEEPDNALLSALSFSQGELSPAFQEEQRSYQLYLPSDVTLLSLEAVPANSKATVNAPKEIRLKPGQDMKILIHITAPDGVTKESYTIKTKRVKKTMAQVEELKKDPHFKGLVSLSATAHPSVVIALCGTAAALLIAGIFTWFYLRKRMPGRIWPKNKHNEEK